MRPIVTDRIVSSVGRSVCLSHTSELCKTAEMIKMPFGLWTRVGPRKHALHGEHIGATWQIGLNRLCAAAMRF